MRRPRVLITAPVLAAGLLLAGCANDDAGSDSQPNETSAPEDTSSEGESSETSSSPTDDSSETESQTGEGGDGCFIHFFDGDDFDENDDNFKLTEPGEYESLKDLPGADQDWSDEADSLKVGESASVTVYSEENFEGDSQDLDPGTEQPDADLAPQSLKMTCE